MKEDPKFSTALIAAFENKKKHAAGKVKFYEVILMKSMPPMHKEIKGKMIELPVFETVIKTRVTKTQARKLMENGVIVSAGYLLNSEL